jgi:Mlc titration factor MtfA (ptsG expression regulator)
VLGMVGNGPMNGQMILSQPALREGFMHEEGRNTGIHEFVHLIDKADGSVDGIPEYLLDRPYIIPWVTEMRREIGNMRLHDTDINPYGATNDAEFFAVVAEYFFERPEALQEHHPALFAMLSKMFHRQA